MRKMKKSMNKSETLINRGIILLPLIILITVLVYLGTLKDIWFCDEVYSYCSSNGINKKMPLLSEDWISGKDVNDYLSATSIGDSNFRAISVKLFKDHVPLYFWIFRIFSLLFMGSCSKWIGLLLNVCLCILAYILILIFFREYTSTSIGTASFLAAAILLHPICVSELTVIRMYFMFSLFQFAIIYIISAENMDLKKYIMLAATTTGGLLTHYYFWFWIAFVSIVYLLLSLTEKERCIKDVFKYLLSMISALLVTTILFPNWIINVLVYDYKGRKALKNMIDLKMVGTSISSALKTVLKIISVKEQFEIPIVILFVFVFLYYCVKIEKNNKIMITIVISSLLHAIFVVQTQPSEEERYLWPSSTVLIFVFIFMATTVINDLVEDVKKGSYKKKVGKILPLLISVLLVCEGINLSCNIENLYFFRRRSEDEVETLKNNSACPWIVFTDAKEWTIYWNLYDFLIPDKLKAVSPQEEPVPDDVLAQSNEVIVYTDTKMYTDNNKEIEDCIKYIEKSGNKKSLGFEKITTTYNMDVYKVYLGTE